MLINDHSQDNYDYKAVANQYNAIYVINQFRHGVAGSRDTGVMRARTPNILFIDAHSKFFSNDWWDVINQAIANDYRAIYNCVCLYLDHKGNRVKGDGHGAYLKFEGDGKGQWIKRWYDVIEAKWNPNRDNRELVEHIGCIMGGAYCFAKDYYNRLRGLTGLRQWGSDEPYLSLKAWLEGGSCKLLNAVEVGTVFRNSAKQPYEVEWKNMIYNKLLIIGTLFPDGLIDRFMEMLEPFPQYTQARIAYDWNTRTISELRGYYEKIRARDFEEAKALASAIYPMSS